jgi:hypothetical protein
MRECEDYREEERKEKGCKERRNIERISEKGRKEGR